MRTADLPIGAHVAVDANKSRSYHSFVEGFVFAHRPKGNRSNYWGIRTGNGDTIGVATTRSYWKDAEGRQTWQFEWVRPADIHMTWDEYQETEARSKARDAKIMAERKAAKADRVRRLQALPKSVLAVIPDYKQDDLVDREQTTMYFSLDMLERIVAAAQAEVPERKAARVAAEVQAALELLAG